MASYAVVYATSRFTCLRHDDANARLLAGSRPKVAGGGGVVVPNALRNLQLDAQNESSVLRPAGVCADSWYCPVGNPRPFDCSSGSSCLHSAHGRSPTRLLRRVTKRMPRTISTKHFPCGRYGVCQKSSSDTRTGALTCRIPWATCTLLFVISPAAASLDRPKTLDCLPRKPLVPAVKVLPDTTEVPAPAEAQLTAETEVYLDGRKCHYKDVPTTAAITGMVLAEDGRTITRIEFSARK